MNDPRVSPDAEPVTDLALQAAYLTWLRLYRVIDPAVVPTAALRDAFTYAWFSALQLEDGAASG